MGKTTTTSTPGGIGAGLRQQRERLGISRAKLAGLAACSPAYIGLVEDGYTPRTGETIGRILAALEEALAERDTAS